MPGDLSSIPGTHGKVQRKTDSTEFSSELRMHTMTCALSLSIMILIILFTGSIVEYVLSVSKAIDLSPNTKKVNKNEIEKILCLMNWEEHDNSTWKC